MKSKIYLFGSLAIILFFAIFSLRFILGGDEDTWLCVNGEWTRHGQPSAPRPVSGCGQEEGGAANSFAECVEGGNPVMESYPRQCRTADGRTFTEDIGTEPEKSGLIRVDNPRPNQAISSPLQISGQARGQWFFEASFPVRLYDDNGWLLAQAPAQAEGDWMSEDFVPFRAPIDFSAPTTPGGNLILEKDNPSGLPEHDDQLRVPVIFEEFPKDINEMMPVKIFLSDSNYFNEPEFDCTRTIEVERQVVKSAGVARASLEALLRGATEAEEARGYTSAISPGTRVQSLNIEQGLAKVDFTDRLEYQVGGSCRVAAIRAQITDTLRQFSSVDRVEITVNSRAEDILQP